MFFDGRNSDLFQLLGLVHARLRTAMLPRELLRKRRSHVDVRMGSPIAFTRLEELADSSHVTAYPRLRTYVLAGRGQPAGGEVDLRRSQVSQPITPRGSNQAMLSEIAALPAHQKLLASGAITVYYGGAPQLPAVLGEIGRLREIAFRAVGEGTGRC